MLDRSRFLGALRSARRLAQRAHAHILRVWRDPVRRDRIAAKATFALIAAFTLGSIDFLIAGGGPDWNPVGAAYAMEAPAPRLATASAPFVVVETPPTLFAAKPDPTDYSVAAEELLGGPLSADLEAPAAASGFAFEATAAAADFAAPAGIMDWR